MSQYIYKYTKNNLTTKQEIREICFLGTYFPLFLLTKARHSSSIWAWKSLRAPR